MTDTFKVLGQSSPSATTSTTLYTVPGSTSTVISTITVCNQNATACTYRISIGVAGAAAGSTNYLAYDKSIDPNDTHTFSLGIGLATTDIVKVYASATLLAFQAFGVEVT